MKFIKKINGYTFTLDLTVHGIEMRNFVEVLTGTGKKGMTYCPCECSRENSVCKFF